MKVIVKKGNEKDVYSFFIDDELLVVHLLEERWQHKSSVFKKGRLHIELLNLKNIELAFSGPINNIRFESQEKCRMYFKIEK